MASVDVLGAFRARTAVKAALAARAAAIPNGWPSRKRNSEVVLSWLSVGDIAKFGTYLACSTTQRADGRGRGVWRSIGMSI
jgi:hypothetical protein